MMNIHGIPKPEVNIPSWMLENDSSRLGVPGKGDLSFLRKTIKEISGVIQSDLMSERFARARGLLQGVDARVKLLSMLYFMVLAGMTQDIFKLAVLAAAALLLARLSGLKIGPYMKRVWLILPLILLVVSIPAATNLIIPGKPFLYIYRMAEQSAGLFFLPRELYISNQGMISVFKMALRLGTSMSFGYLLIMTTRWSHVSKALSILKLPKLLITVLEMTYRYIFVLSRLSTEMIEARYLRTVGNVKNSENRGFVARSMAFLFVRSSYMSEEIYDSMVCRGFTGESVALSEFKLTANDLIWAVNVIVISIVVILL